MNITIGMCFRRCRRIIFMQLVLKKGIVSQFCVNSFMSTRYYQLISPIIIHCRHFCSISVYTNSRGYNTKF